MHPEHANPTGAMSAPHLIVSCSLRQGSHSARLAEGLAERLRRADEEVELIDLRRFELPWCDDGECYSHPNVRRLRRAISGAPSVTLAVPVYNFDGGAAARNVVALTGRVWTGKLVGLLAAAGGARSYMAPMGLAESLMLDFRCLVVPRYVYATRAAFDGGRLIDDGVEARLDDLARELARLAPALEAATARQSAA